jgi:DNA-binding XRE family transcriptional regulator
LSRPNFKEFRKKALQRTDVAREYAELAPAYQLRRRMIAIRQQAGLTQQQMAEAMATHKGNISRLENVDSGISPTLATIERYARAAGHRVEIHFVPEKK